ncbi:hypothetical protein Hypma_013300 [Hypsizygus marmoreus]|uniref:Uncharacterized protein n=1 Tax=Hypsizygus marmoreus TaxID=39966 RepID=A0A369JE51_HYPMA|nr:hypothetical protein Hypma_013300 [Hypsizygus marmoreus]
MLSFCYVAVTMPDVLIRSECVSAATKVRWGTCYGIFFRHTILRALPAVELPRCRDSTVVSTQALAYKILMS